MGNTEGDYLEDVDLDFGIILKCYYKEIVAMGGCALESSGSKQTDWLTRVNMITKLGVQQKKNQGFIGFVGNFHFLKKDCVACS